MPVAVVVPPLPAKRAFSTGFKVVLGTFAAFVMLVVLAAFLSDADTPSAAKTELGAGMATAAPVAERATAASGQGRQKSGLSMENYLRIADSMTYQEVVAILGEPGEELSRSDLAGITTVMYAWQRWNGANMNAMFQNNKLVSKAQFGLN